MLLSCGDIEENPEPSPKYVACGKTLRKSQSKITFSRCSNDFHVQCFPDDNREMLCTPCLLVSEPQTEKRTLEQISQRKIRELQKLITQRGLKILHQNIRGILSKKSFICALFQNFKNIDILGLIETHLNNSNKNTLEIPEYKFLSKP